MDNKHANKIISRIAQEMKTCDPIELQDDEIAAIRSAVRDGGAAELLRELRDMAEKGGTHARRAWAISKCAWYKCFEMSNTAQDCDRKKWRNLCYTFDRFSYIAQAIVCGINPNRAFWETTNISECERHKIRSILRDCGLKRINTASYSWRDYRGIGCVFAPKKQAIRFYTGRRITSDYSQCEYWQ